MAQQYWFRFAVLLAYFVLSITALPRQNESPILLSNEEPILTDTTANKKERSLHHENINEDQQENTKDILEKIKALNSGLKKPTSRPQNNKNKGEPNTGGGFVLDSVTLAKIQEIIASGKLHSLQKPSHEESRLSDNDDSNYLRYDYSRAFNYGQLPANFLAGQGAPVPYISSLPVIVLPSSSIYGGLPSNNDLNSIDSNPYQTRQGPPSLPFQLQWPLAQYFPILIKDPLLGFLHGGGWNNFVEYGQSADVCKRKQKSEDIDQEITEIETDDSTNENLLNSDNASNSRQGKALKKRTISKPAHENALADIKQSKKFLATTLLPKKKPVKSPYVEEQAQDIKSTEDPNEGDLRFPFGDFTWFGNKKPVAPSPGFFINRLKVRKGGVAIAGPGGVATAGRGGTAIVGPGGLAYTQPGGLAVAGPAARIVALPSDADLHSIVSRLQEQSATDGSVSRLLEAIPEGKVVATGPVVFYHPKEQTASVEYIPFVGGAKGQYLELKRDKSGNVISERIVSEENISSENIVKNSNENLLSRVLSANLKSLETLSGSLLKIHNVARNTGFLGNSEKDNFKKQLDQLVEAASNTIKLVDEIADDVDALYRNTTQRQYTDFEQDVGEEGVGIDAPVEAEVLGGTLIAEAKPIGLAVIGENGIAASRPVGTAVASSGIAIARPIATAIAGVNPAELGIQFQINQAKH